MGPDDQTAIGRRRLVAWSGAIVGALGAVGWFVGAGGWPGAPSGCIAAGDCSCEAFGPGIVLQPINALSSLALVIAGIGILWFLPTAARDRRRRTGYAATVVGLGVGSAAFHASMTEWGGWMDLIGIHLFLGYVLVVGVAEFAAVSDRGFLATVAGGGTATAVALWFMDNGFGKYTAAALVAAIAVTEWLLRSRPARSNRRWLWSAVGLFTVGLAVQWLGRGGGPWCDPDRLLQPHAVWHGIAALGAVTLYRHLFGSARRGSNTRT
jgi:hypothetical protein